MNQKARQAATSSVEKDFYKLLNNSNFDIHCRNNIDNCYLEPVYDDFSEISYVKILEYLMIPSEIFFPLFAKRRNTF